MPDSQMIINPIFIYTINDFKHVTHNEADTCEDICKLLCKELQLAPIVQTLFGLRISEKQNLWLAGNKQLSPNTNYDFRLRFKVDPVLNLKQLSKEAYNYYYYQVRNDVLCDEISEIEYPKFKEKVLGLCSTDMYRELIEYKYSVEQLKQNYGNYIPHKLKRKHRLFVKRKIYEFLDEIKYKSHDPYFVREVYLKDLHKMAPDYLSETFTVESDYMKEDGFNRKGLLQVKVQIAPHHKETPGIRIYYPYKDSWAQVYKMEDLCNMTLDKDVVQLQFKNEPDGRSFTIKDPFVMESFITCIAGYYRLMVKWSLNICPPYYSPSLKKLTEIKCHGPIGGSFSYTKLERNGNLPGSYILRQCENSFDTFYVDIIIRTTPETFKIIKNKTGFVLHKRDGTTESFDTLQKLAESIEVHAKRHIRLSPSEYDKPPQLLLCATPEEIQTTETVNDLSALKNMQPRIIKWQSLLLYKNTGQEVDFKRMDQFKADWLLPNNKKIDTTIKVLKPIFELENLSNFMDLADLWSGIDSPNIIRLFGVTLESKNRCFVFENYDHGPLDEFLRKRNKKKDQHRKKDSQANEVPTQLLIDAAFCLAIALHYLQDNSIIHGRIRCANVLVKSFVPNVSLEVKLGDPGLQRPYDSLDIPWIPIEYFNDLESAKKDLKADIWAYATTLWEIFSRGTPIKRIENPIKYFSNGERLKPPPECTNCREVYEIMREGWDEDPDKRFSSQFILSRLSFARQRLTNQYTELNYTKSNNYTNQSVRTDSTYLPLDDYTPMPNGHGSCTANSDSSLASGTSTFIRHVTGYANGHSDDSGADDYEEQTTYNPLQAEAYQSYTNKKISWNHFDITFKEKLGEGNFGLVYKGILCNRSTGFQNFVALKTLNVNNNEQDRRDMMRESEIMMQLEHPNIVRIITFVRDYNYLVIVMELVKNDSFERYLSSHRPNLTSNKLLKFAKDIASGMAYLQSKSIVHRDLAARNILVENEDCVKISDFGLAQVVENGYYMVQTSNRAMPFMWYAPEAIQENKFSFFSDVWSYGITLFEMFSLGKRPFEELSVQFPEPTHRPPALLEMLEKNIRLDRPDNCPEVIYETLMYPCWAYDPHDRPLFSHILDIINNLIEKYKECVEFNTYYS